VLRDPLALAELDYVRLGAAGMTADIFDDCRRLLEKLNAKPFRKRQGSRLSLLEAIDRPALRPLPLERFDLSQWSRARVNIDYHIPRWTVRRSTARGTRPQGVPKVSPGEEAGVVLIFFPVRTPAPG
jgi:hypothetical protein